MFEEIVFKNESNLTLSRDGIRAISGTVNDHCKHSYETLKRDEDTFEVFLIRKDSLHELIREANQYRKIMRDQCIIAA